MAISLERRFLSFELRSEATDENKLVGIAAPYGTWSQVLFGRFREKIERGAFDRSLKENNIKALLQHDPNQLLGRTGSQTLRLSSTDQGLAFELDIPNHDIGYRLREMVKRKDISQCSFGFYVRDGGDQWDRSKTPWERTLVDVDLREISFVDDPAYSEGTSANLRHFCSGYLQSEQKRAKNWFAFKRLLFSMR
jgi:HK97 family phage prohead protease